MQHVAIAGGTDETRLLLRGLVRLHHHRVVAEGFGPETLEELPKDSAATVVLIDADLDDARWAETVRRCAESRPGTRIVLLTASRSPQVEARARGLGVVALLHRPFAVHELVAVIEPPTSGSCNPLNAARPLARPLHHP